MPEKTPINQEPEPEKELEAEIPALDSKNKTPAGHAPSALAKKRSPQEAAALKDRLHFVARSLADNFNLKFIPGRGWSAGLSKEFEKQRRLHPEKSLEEFDPKLLQPEVITYSEADLLERSEDFDFGVLRHELSHIHHSDYQVVVEVSEAAKKEGYRPMDVFMIYNSWEDGRSNALEADGSPRARYRLGTYLKEDIAESLLKDFKDKPLSIQYGLLCWAKGAEPFIEGFDFEDMKAKIKEPRVLEALAKTDEVLADYLKTANGRKAFKEILWEKGWPVFKELVDHDIENKAKKKHEESKAGNQPKPEPGQSPEAGDQPQPENGGDETPKEKDETQGAGAQPEKEPWDDLSEAEKNAYREEAREELSEEEKEIVVKLQPKSMPIEEQPDGTITVQIEPVAPEDLEAAEAEEAANAAAEAAAQETIKENKGEVAKNLKDALDKLKERTTGLPEGAREQYAKYYAEVRKYVDLLAEKLDKVFPPQKEAKWQGGYQRGKKIDAKSLAREIPIGRGKFFERKDVPEIREAAFSLLIDVSGSMNNEKIHSAVKAALLMAEALSKKGVPFEILAFNRRFFELKQFEDQYAGAQKLALMGLLREVHGPDATYNDDGFAVDTAARRLQKRLLENDAQGALIVFSDGQPAPGPEHNGMEWELGGIVQKWSRQLPLIGVGIGPGMEETIQAYFGKNGLPVPDIDKLPRALLNILEKQVARFTR